MLFWLILAPLGLVSAVCLQRDRGVTCPAHLSQPDLQGLQSVAECRDLPWVVALPQCQLQWSRGPVDLVDEHSADLLWVSLQRAGVLLIQVSE